jgi:hypothetical protein
MLDRYTDTSASSDLFDLDKSTIFAGLRGWDQRNDVVELLERPSDNSKIHEFKSAQNRAY